MRSQWMPALALRIAIYFVLVPLAFIVVVPDSFETIHWWLTTKPVPEDEPVAQTAPPVPVLPPAPLPPARPPEVQIALPPIPPSVALLAQTQRMQDLFDHGRMHELYADFSDDAKVQVPEDVFVAQASSVLQQLGPRADDVWRAAGWVPAWLKGLFIGREIVSWIPHPETSTLDVESERFGSLADSHEHLVLDLSRGRVKLAMFSEAREGLPAASISLPRTCRHAEEDPFQQCHLRAALATASDAIVIPTPGNVWVSTAVAIDPDGHAQIAAVGSGGWLLMASCRTTPCRGDAMITRTHALALSGPVALAIGREGLPMTAVTANSRVMLVRCDDRPCSKISSSAVAMGQALGLVVGLDGFPLITYSVFDEHTLATQLRLARCRDATCTQPAITLAVGALDRRGSNDSSIAMAGDGRAVIAVVGPERTSGSDASMLFARCADRMCSALTLRELVIRGNTATLRVPLPGTMDTHGAGAGIEAVVLHAGAQGGPVMGYTMYKDGESLLRILRCADSDCAGGLATHTIREIDDASSIAAEIDSEDRPVFAAIAYRGEGAYPNALPRNVDPPPPDYEILVALLQCATPSCASIGDTIPLGSIGVGRGGEPQLARRQDGTLVTIAFDPHRPAILVWDAALDH